MNYNGKKVIQTVHVVHVVDGIEQSEIHGKSDTISQLDVPPYVFLVFEPFQMKSQDIW